MTDIVRTERLLKVQERLTLGHVNMRLASGEILGIMGPKGSGKSTLLRILWGFVQPSAGKVHVFGLAPHLHQIQVRMRAGYVSKAPTFYDWMTARDFLQF